MYQRYFHRNYSCIQRISISVSLVLLVIIISDGKFTFSSATARNPTLSIVIFLG
ncbi:unnamed protein product [Callosobruchus maculatus]|uniref:Uncharacterized protein n=1 Tax=Callosobruchus maculatus TaxID=64391 RepID=A0A653D232_CALMS|nr:unnamed protein product [Callosobruchus maculatus]